MAPPRDGKVLAATIIADMGCVSEQKPSRYGRKIAKSPELKSFLICLSERYPLIMYRQLKEVGKACEEAAKNGKEVRIARKRAAPTYDDGECGRSAKRSKGFCGTEEEIVQQAGVDDGEDVLMKVEIPNLQSKPQTFGTAAPHVSSEEEDDIAVSPSVELGLLTGSSLIEARVRASLVALGSQINRPNFNVQDEINKVWKIIPLLSFYKTRREAYQHLASRQMMSNEELRARTDWNISEPSEILDALENVKRSTIDNKIHRAYGQTKLFTSVNTHVSSGYKATINGYKSNHIALLEELARKKAGYVSKTEIEQIIASYISEYHTGQKWLAIMDWFGGSGIVLIFVIAGLGNWNVKTWTEFQRNCVQHIAGLLNSVRGLVEILGADALERYCRQGRLGNDCLDRVKEAEFAQSDTAKEPEDGQSDTAVESEDCQSGAAEGREDDSD